MKDHHEREIEQRSPAAEVVENTPVDSSLETIVAATFPDQRSSSHLSTAEGIASIDSLLDLSRLVVAVIPKRASHVAAPRSS